ncbi:MAG: 3-oxoadipate enol-lactonase [Sneathiella sp.]|nr:3-oxoadipate enol-lactonase [Sneathiella sp.]
MKFLKTNHTTIHYQVLTKELSAPVLVFSNSLGTDFRIWDEVVEDLCRDSTIVTYDKRGHGLSDLGTTPYTLDDHVDDLEALLDHLKCKQAIVCGLSVGGLIAQGLYARRPDLVAALILCDTAHVIGTPAMWQERMDALQAGGLAPMVNAVMERWFTPSFREDKNSSYQICRTMFERQDLAGYIGTCAAIRDTDLTAQAKKIMVPTLCLVGDQDAATPPEVVQELANLIPGAKYQIIENAGHIPCVEQPQIFTAMIKEFTQNLSVGDC